LDYFKWKNFAKVIQHAMIACQNSGHTIDDEFPEVRKIVKAGATKRMFYTCFSYRALN
jgi:DNA-damage-inducible protein D